VKNIMASMYCVKCRAKKEDPNAVKVTMKNGKPAMKGKCPTCGTGMYKIGG
jgi:RNase P subunit RPR2